MGTDDLDERLQYSMMMNAILKYMKDTESITNLSGLQKKERVLKYIRNMPIIHEEHPLFIDVMIDTLVAVSNNPLLIRSR
jgi:hypothetical protein